MHGTRRAAQGHNARGATEWQALEEARLHAVVLREGDNAVGRECEATDSQPIDGGFG
ncbi:MAG: hypothetical protein ACK56F_11125 [bacterium]